MYAAVRTLEHRRVEADHCRAHHASPAAVISADFASKRRKTWEADDHWGKCFGIVFLLEHSTSLPPRWIMDLSSPPVLSCAMDRTEDWAAWGKDSALGFLFLASHVPSSPVMLTGCYLTRALSPSQESERAIWVVAVQYGLVYLILSKLL